MKGVCEPTDTEWPILRHSPPHASYQWATVLVLQTKQAMAVMKLDSILILAKFMLLSSTDTGCPDPASQCDQGRDFHGFV